MCKALANNIQLCHDVEKHLSTKNQLQKPIKKIQPLRFFINHIRIYNAICFIKFFINMHASVFPKTQFFLLFIIEPFLSIL